MARILIVEDDSLSASLFVTVLERMGGHAVTVTENADQVLALAEEDRIDLLILDVSLRSTFLGDRKVDGLTLSRTLKTRSATAGLPILLVTAHAMRGDREAFLKESMADEYLTKPILDHRQFCQLVERMIARSGADRPTAQAGPTGTRRATATGPG
jgi:CheY-like chemotaxis protein